MASKAGVWIDHRRAVVVLVTDAGIETKTIPSDVGRTDRPASDAKAKNRYTGTDFVAEDKLERKLASRLKEYFDEIIACVRDAEEFLILGPGEAKGEFLKRLKSKKFRGNIAELKTSDKMTDWQIAAKVRGHFATAAAGKSVRPKAAKTTSRLRKKSGT